MNKTVKQLNIKKNAGVALVEITIVLPFLFLLMFAAIEGGRYLYSYNTLTKLNRDSVRYISDGLLDVDPNLTPEKKARNFVIYGRKDSTTVKELLPGLSDPFKANIAVTINDTYIFIAIDYDYESIFGQTINFFSFGNNIDFTRTMHSEIYMRVINDSSN